MLELGNGQFVASSSALNAANARSHFSMWAVMKAVLLLGCDLNNIDSATLEIIKNTEAIAINQDSWGKQARRIRITTPKNAAITAPDHALTIAAKCDASNPMQKWHLVSNGTAPSHLYSIDPAGHAWCLHFGDPMIAEQCNPESPITNNGDGWQLKAAAGGRKDEYNLLSIDGRLGLSIHNEFGGSGRSVCLPLPRTYNPTGVSTRCAQRRLIDLCCYRYRYRLICQDWAMKHPINV